MHIICELCGNEAEITKKNVSFYVKWLEVEPERFICRECERKFLWPNLIQYKLRKPFQSLRKLVPEEEHES